jgi:hypothetical protein
MAMTIDVTDAISAVSTAGSIAHPHSLLRLKVQARPPRRPCPIPQPGARANALEWRGWNKYTRHRLAESIKAVSVRRPRPPAMPRAGSRRSRRPARRAVAGDQADPGQAAGGQVRRRTPTTRPRPRPRCIAPRGLRGARRRSPGRDQGVHVDHSAALADLQDQRVRGEERVWPGSSGRVRNASTAASRSAALDSCRRCALPGVDWDGVMDGCGRHGHGWRLEVAETWLLIPASGSSSGRRRTRSISPCPDCGPRGHCAEQVPRKADEQESLSDQCLESASPGDVAPHLR